MTPNQRSGYHFSEDDKAIFRLLWTAGIKPEIISQTLQRSTTAIYRYAERYELPSQSGIHKKLAAQIVAAYNAEKANEQKSPQLA